LVPARQVRRSRFTDVERAGADSSLCCAFCSKMAPHVEDVIAGPGVAICSDCVALCVEILAEKSASPDGPRAQ
jgi:ATP-dependent Clp protease ATP-binding subunit ClpX